MSMKKTIASLKAYKEMTRTAGGNLVGIDPGSMTVEHKGVTVEDYSANGIGIGSVVTSSKDDHKTNRLVTDVVFTPEGLVMVYNAKILPGGELGPVLMNTTARTEFRLVTRKVEAILNAPRIAELTKIIADAQAEIAKLQ